MSPKAKQEEPLLTPHGKLISNAIANCEELIHNLRLSYDMSPQKRVSDIIVAQELSLMELKALLK